MDNVVREETKSLHEKSTLVNLPLNDEDKNTLIELLRFVISSQNDEMCQSFNLRPSVGIAAPQIGINKRMFAMSANDLNGKRFTFMVVNPTIIYRSKEMTYLPNGEGCLSVDREINQITPRHKKIKIDCHLYDLKTDRLIHKIFNLEDYIAIVFQHEYDHLDGVLFVDKLMDEKLAKEKGYKPLWEEDES